MYDVIGALLPLALAISLSPFPVIAIVLLSRSPRANSAAFTTAWMLSILTSTIVFTAIAKLIEPDDTSGPDPLAGVIRLLLGAALLVLAVRKFRAGSATDDAGAPPMPHTAPLLVWNPGRRPQPVRPLRTLLTSDHG